MTELDRPPPLDPSRHALFLDFDGTLVDFAPSPDAIELRPGTRELLARVGESLGGALAIVSGRRIKDLDRHLGPSRFPAAGVHGHELRRAGSASIVHPPPLREIGIARQRILDRLAPDDPLRLEDKAYSLVLHFRTHPELAQRARAIADESAAGLAKLRVDHGHRIFEIRPIGITKARALVLLQDAPFAGRTPVFVGDDVTDEDGIRAAMAAGGIGIRVGPGKTEAPYRLPSVTAVHRWLSGGDTLPGDEERMAAAAR